MAMRKRFKKSVKVSKFRPGKKSKRSPKNYYVGGYVA